MEEVLLLQTKPRNELERIELEIVEQFLKGNKPESFVKYCEWQAMKAGIESKHEGHELRSYVTGFVFSCFTHYVQQQKKCARYKEWKLFLKLVIPPNQKFSFNN